MSHLNSLTSIQKTQLRNAFALIDGETKDSLITKDDLRKLYSTLGLPPPPEDQLNSMLQIDQGGVENGGINFTQFSNIMAKELSKFEDRSVIYEALKTFNNNSDGTDLTIDLQEFKDACCSVQLGDIGSGDHRLSRSTFDRLVQGFIQEQINGKQVFLASKWLDAYID
ncbi:hypothetical protein JA1_004527 [Spathaspora sp. JA1]|nr:hypothetical protein JA1_004527 [Spathaspora sp. JA1]